MKPEQKQAIDSMYMNALFKKKKPLSVLDDLSCPCEDEKAKNCRIYGYYPQFCKPIQDKVESILKS